MIIKLKLAFTDTLQKGDKKKQGKQTPLPKQNSQQKPDNYSMKTTRH